MTVAGGFGVPIEVVSSIMANVVVTFARSEHSQLAEIILVDVNPSNISLIKEEVHDQVSMIHSGHSPSGLSKPTARSDPVRPSGTPSSTFPSDAGARPKHPLSISGKAQPLPSRVDPNDTKPSPSADLSDMGDYSGILSASAGGAQTSRDSFVASVTSAPLATGDDDDDDDDDDAADADVDDQCPICMDAFTSPKKLTCGHKFCSDCIDSAFAHKSVCPICGEVYGVLKGNQPEGKMSTSVDYSAQIPGYPQASALVIKYHFKDGIQGVSINIDVIVQDVNTCIHTM